MGSPISSIMAEIFLKQLEQIHYPELIKNRHIRKHIRRYVDDIIIMYDSPTYSHCATLTSYFVMV
jgi:hypothetical protein